MPLTHTHRRRNEERSTPRLDAWLENLRPHLEPRGAQSDLARFISGSNDVRIIRRWVTTFFKWFHKGAMPGPEEILTVNAWLESKHARKKKPAGSRV